MRVTGLQLTATVYVSNIKNTCFFSRVKNLKDNLPLKSRLSFCIKKTSSSAGGSESFSYTQKKEPSNIHSATAKKHYENQEVQMDEQSLAHTKWNCKYHGIANII